MRIKWRKVPIRALFQLETSPILKMIISIPAATKSYSESYPQSKKPRKDNFKWIRRITFKILISRSLSNPTRQTRCQMINQIIIIKIWRVVEIIRVPRNMRNPSKQKSWKNNKLNKPHLKNKKSPNRQHIIINKNRHWSMMCMMSVWFWQTTPSIL